MVRQCYVLFEIEVYKKYIFFVWTKRFSFVVMMNIHEEDGVGSCSNVITGRVCSISIHSDDSERHEKVDFFLLENEMIDHTRMLKRCIHDAWFKWYWQGACQVDKTSWRFGNWFDLNGRKSVMVFWKRRNFVMSAYLYRASMHKIINIIEKWGYVLFEMMKVHEKYRYMQIST